MSEPRPGLEPTPPTEVPPGDPPANRQSQMQRWPELPPPKRSRKRLWLGLGVLAVLLLVAGAVTVVMVMSSEGRVRLVTPPTVAGLTLDTGPQSQADAKATEEDLLRDTDNADEAVAAFYYDPNDETKVVLLIGYTGEIRDPVGALNRFLSSFDSPSPSGIYDIDPGPLGGVTKCTNDFLDGERVFACAWADRDNAAAIVFANTDPDSGEALFRQMRQQIQTRE
jgi:hypothetical protein